MEIETGKIMQQLDSLKVTARELILAIGQDKSKDELHRMSVDILLEITDLERLVSVSIKDNKMKDEFTLLRNYKKFIKCNNVNSDEFVEIKKVERKLKRWAVNQHQINSKILNLFLKLNIDEKDIVTEEILMEQYGNKAEFYRNFNQMKVISQKNHAKVFEVKDGIVEIWVPVRKYVEEYKNIIFGEF